MNSMWELLILSFVALTTVAATQAGPPTASIVCLFKNCLNEVTDCELEKEKYCLYLLECQEACFSRWDTDQTSQKTEVQKCTSECQFSYLYKQPVSAAFIDCAATHGCVSIADIPSTCKESVKASRELSVKDLEGEWWVVRGYNKVYDCYPCERFGFTMSSTGSGIEYRARYQTQVENGSLVTISQRFSIPSIPAGEPIKFSGIDAGIPLENTWYLLDKATDGSYVLVYYCGNALTWNYEGAIVLSRKSSLPETAYNRIASVYNTTVGIGFNNFCYPRVEDCAVN